MTVAGHIALRGVKVHNLKSVDLDIPRQQLIVLCGVSGSGKSSLAIDTLYAEGQRRYIESFSAYTRQFLERLEKPEAERIDGLPPAIAVTGRTTGRSSRATVGTATDATDYLRLLMAKIGHIFCRRCRKEVRRDTPQSVAETLAALPAGTRYLLAFAPEGLEPGGLAAAAAALREEGFVRMIAAGRVVELDAVIAAAKAQQASGAEHSGTRYSVLGTRYSGTGYSVDSRQYPVLSTQAAIPKAWRSRSPAHTSWSIGSPSAGPARSGSAIRWRPPSPRATASAAPSSSSPARRKGTVPFSPDENPSSARVSRPRHSPTEGLRDRGDLRSAVWLGRRPATTRKPATTRGRRSAVSSQRSAVSSQHSASGASR